MRCSRCHARFSASWAQPAPGGSSAPGWFLLTGLGLVAASMPAWWLEDPYAAWALLAVGAVVLVKVPIAWGDCRGKSGLSPHGGGTCPNCGAHNAVRFWSL